MISVHVCERERERKKERWREGEGVERQGGREENECQKMNETYTPSYFLKCLVFKLILNLLCYRNIQRFRCVDVAPVSQLHSRQSTLGHVSGETPAATTQKARQESQKSVPEMPLRTVLPNRHTGTQIAPKGHFDTDRNRRGCRTVRAGAFGGAS